MKVVLQRVARATVSVDERTVGEIGRGFVALVGFTPGDTQAAIEWMAEKVVGLRVFADGEGKMNRDIRDVGGSILVVSQFTLYGDARKGRRPSFVNAAPPDEAEAAYGSFVNELIKREVPVQTGEFGALMKVDLVNDGPVTLILER